MAPDVAALVSHATQERLHGLLVKLTAMAAHRKAAMKVQLYRSSFGHDGLTFTPENATEALPHCLGLSGGPEAHQSE